MANYYPNINPENALILGIVHRDSLPWMLDNGFGMKLLATLDWLLARERVGPNVPASREELRHWRGGPEVATREHGLFDDRALGTPLVCPTRLPPRGLEGHV